ncbi:Type VI secretion lipoprotein [compost metagenome]
MMAAVELCRGLSRATGCVALVACMAVLQGCQRPAEPQAPVSFTPVKSLLLETALDVNPNLYGRPSPVVLTVYQLSDAEAFMHADPAQLASATPPQEAAWLAQRSFQLSPGESRVYHFEPDAELRLLGVVVHYRDLDNSHWRATQVFEPRSPEALRVSLAREQVTIHAVPLEEMLSSVQ